MMRGQAFLPGQGGLAALLLAGGLVGVGACQVDDKAELPPVDYDYFVQKAYPVMLRDCAFPACHGNSERLFQVYGPGRVRMRKPDGVYPGLFGIKGTPEELRVSFNRSRSMLLHRGELTSAPLLRKPLQGGAHFGTDLWQRNVYRNAKQSGYVILKQWAEGATLDSKSGDKGGSDSE